MYAIADEETGRYLSRWSVPDDEKGNVLYITYSGKIGTDFFSDLIEAEILLNRLLYRIKGCGALKLLQIVEVNPDVLQLGEHITEILNDSPFYAVI